MEEKVLHWIAQNGYPAIFGLLVLGIVGLPVPDETLLTFTGYLIYKHSLQPLPAFFSAFLGSAAGITISYLLGRYFGLALIHKFGRYLHVTEESINKAHSWFERVGRWALTFGYFIPGVRHLTAYAAGISELKPQWFAVFAYAGAVLWTTAFLCLGYFLGEKWEIVLRKIEHHSTVVTIVVACLIAAWFLWLRFKPHKRGQ